MKVNLNCRQIVDSSNYMKERFARLDVIVLNKTPPKGIPRAAFLLCIFSDYPSLLEELPSISDG